jgi:flagellar biogenesis protein FliO
LLAIAVVSCLTSATAQSSRPAQASTTAPRDGVFDREQLRRATQTHRSPTTVRAAENAPSGSSPASSPSAATAANVTNKNLFDLRQILIALAIVIGLIFALRWIGKRLFPGLGSGRSSGAVRVVSRSVLTPRQQVLLVQVGARRLLVVADNGTQVSTLCQITDADEIASLVGQISGSTRGSRDADRAFDSALDNAKSQFDGPAASVSNHEDAQDASTTVVASNEIADLMQKVRGLARQLGR